MDAKRMVVNERSGGGERRRRDTLVGAKEEEEGEKVQQGTSDRGAVNSCAFLLFPRCLHQSRV